MQLDEIDFGSSSITPSICDNHRWQNSTPDRHSMIIIPPPLLGILRYCWYIRVDLISTRSGRCIVMIVFVLLGVNNSAPLDQYHTTVKVANGNSTSSENKRKKLSRMSCSFMRDIRTLYVLLSKDWRGNNTQELFLKWSPETMSELNSALERES